MSDTLPPGYHVHRITGQSYDVWAFVLPGDDEVVHSKRFHDYDAAVLAAWQHHKGETT